MQYATIESIEEEIKEIKNMIGEILNQESFFIRKIDLECIEKGREDYVSGKVISGDSLRRFVE